MSTFWGFSSVISLAALSRLPRPEDRREIEGWMDCQSDCRWASEADADERADRLADKLERRLAVCGPDGDCVKLGVYLACGAY